MKSMSPKYRVVAVLSAVALAVPLLTAASAGTGALASREWTKREVVQGLVMARGPVAERLGFSQSNVQTMSPKALKVADEVESRIVDEMLDSHGDDVTTAANLLTSGDPYQVEDGRRLLASVFRESVGVTNPDIAETTAAEPRCGLIAPCGVVAVLGAALGVAVVVVAEVAVVGQAAVYAKNAFWGRNVTTDPAADGSTVPAFSEAEITSLITERLGS
jgi:hypothetical protein